MSLGISGIPIPMLRAASTDGPAFLAPATDSGSARSARDGFDAEARREAEFTALVDRQAAFLFRVAFSLLRNPHDAEDAVQETLLKLFRGDAWREMDDERAFLARTVWRVGLDRLARNGGKAMRFAEDVADLELASADESPEQQAVDAAQRTLLRKLIDGLGDDLRIPLVLCAIEGMTSAQVAVTLGIPEGTIRTRLMRARTELKRRFAATQPRKETRR